MATLWLSNVEMELVGRPLTAAVFAAAAAVAADTANPLSQTGYKRQLLVGTVLETLGRAAGR